MNDSIDYEKLNQLALSVLKLSRNTLVINLRFMDTAISRLEWISLPELIVQAPEYLTFSGLNYATDGTAIVYDPVSVCKDYASEKSRGPRGYLHMVLHCIFRHFHPSPTMNPVLWDLACDMAVEGVINGLQLPALMSQNSARQTSELNRIAPKVNQLLTAEKLYYYLSGAELSDDQLAELRELFSMDSHDIWYASVVSLSLAAAGKGMSSKDSQTSSEESSTTGESFAGRNGNASDTEHKSASGNDALDRDWKDISERIQLDMETFSKNRGDMAGNMMQNLREVNREKCDYTEFLKKFAVMGEVMKINQDEFDYVFYTYGMQLFPDRRMPLIEPLEYRDMKRIREFVIAIDTSGSVQGDQVQAFIQKTYNILKSTDSFFSRINLHILQCDSQIQEDVKITCQRDFDEYIKTMTLRGFGGTDFRPVFQYVDQMIANHEFTNLKGLIYFTDGYGAFPARMPDYRTAFVFVKDQYAIPSVPVWAMRLVLQREEL